MSRHSALTDELRVAIERELATGASAAVVAQRVGVSRRNVTYWLAEGKVARQPVAPTPIPAPDLALSVSERLAKAEPALTAVVIAAAQRGSWAAATWLLERRWPERWLKPTERPLAPSQASSDDEAQAFAEIIDLARRRPRRPSGKRR